jgi:hypothetical protein
MTHPLIGLTGRKRSGKDTFAARLVDAHGYTRLAFADALREAALALDPIIEMHWFGEVRLSEVVERDGWEQAKAEPEVRRTLQRFGVGIRKLDPDFWLRVVAERAEWISGPVVVTDVRFTNEADWIEREEGHLVRIERPGLDTSDTHESETALDDRETRFRVVNDHNVEQLIRHADTIHRLVS